MRHVRGRVLDVGCGAGRVAIHLEPRGQAVLSIDVSPGAVRTAGERGARDVRLLAASGSSNEVELTRRIPVHVTFFTAVAGDDGQVKYFGDVYGHDRRVTAALEGKALPMEVAASSSDTPVKDVRKGKNTKQSSNDFVQGLFGN